MAKQQWQLYEWYRGCPIEHRPGLKRRGWATTYRNCYADDRHVGSFVHHSLENARAHIDKLHNDLGDQVTITQEEFDDYCIPFAMRKHIMGIRLAEKLGLTLELRKDGKLSTKDARQLLNAGYVWYPAKGDWVPKEILNGGKI